jgi:hypothetical protein
MIYVLFYKVCYCLFSQCRYTAFNVILRRAANTYCSSGRGSFGFSLPVGVLNVLLLLLYFYNDTPIKDRKELIFKAADGRSFTNKKPLIF